MAFCVTVCSSTLFALLYLIVLLFGRFLYASDTDSISDMVNTRGNMKENGMVQNVTVKTVT